MHLNRWRIILKGQKQNHATLGTPSRFQQISGCSSWRFVRMSCILLPLPGAGLGSCSPGGDWHSTAWESIARRIHNLQGRGSCCQHLWNHRFYRHRAGETEARCLTLPSLLSPAQGAWALLGTQGSPDSHQPFHNFLPQFDAIVWLLTMPLVEESLRWTAKEWVLAILFGCFFPFRNPGCCFINALLTHTCAGGGQGTFASQKWCPQFIQNLCTAKTTAIKYPPVTQHLAQPWPASAILSGEER